MAQGFMSVELVGAIETRPVVPMAVDAGIAGPAGVPGRSAASARTRAAQTTAWNKASGCTSTVSIDRGQGRRSPTSSTLRAFQVLTTRRFTGVGQPGQRRGGVDVLFKPSDHPKDRLIADYSMQGRNDGFNVIAEIQISPAQAVGTYLARTRCQSRAGTVSSA